jgi:hypothetical protein
MFIGHFALGYAAKRWAPGVSLGVLFAAVVFADLLWPVLVAFGIEQVRIVPGHTRFTPLEFISYPYSHSLVMLTLWGVVFGWLATRGTRRASTSALRAPVDRPVAPALVLAMLVVSHWILDVVTHAPDMPIYPGGPRFGLGLWNSVPGTLAVETVMFVIGVWIYVHATKSRDPIGTWVFLGLTAFLGLGFVINASSPPPPSITALWVVALALGGLTLWLAWWADSHREPR